MVNDKLLQAKTELQCFGVKPTKAALDFYNTQNPYKAKRTGNVGLHFLLGKKLWVLTTLSHKFNLRSPFEINKKGAEWFLSKQDKQVCPIQIVEMPAWYEKKTSRGTPMPDVFLDDGPAKLHQIYSGCGYFTTGEQCLFCSAGKQFKSLDSRDVGETVQAAFKENSKYEVCLSAGTPLSADKGASYHLRNISSIRERNKKVPIFVEMTPPDENKFLDQLVSAGANSFSLNLEVWNDQLRKKICPGKAKVLKQRYFDAFGFIETQLGKNKTNCVLLAGLQPAKDIVEGAERLAMQGVKPDIMPFKPWDGSAYENHSLTDPAEFAALCQKTAEIMVQYGVNPRKNSGCASCNGCSPVNDYFKCL